MRTPWVLMLSRTSNSARVIGDIVRYWKLVLTCENSLKMIKNNEGDRWKSNREIKVEVRMHRIQCLRQGLQVFFWIVGRFWYKSVVYRAEGSCRSRRTWIDVQGSCTLGIPHMVQITCTWRLNVWGELASRYKDGQLSEPLARQMACYHGKYRLRTFGWFSPFVRSSIRIQERSKCFIKTDICPFKDSPGEYRNLVRFMGRKLFA